MKITHWKQRSNDPFNDFFDLDSPHWGLSLLPALNRGLNSGKNLFFPAVDITEEKDHVKVTVDVPGLSKEEISLSAEGSFLTIRGERKQEDEKKEKQYHRIERSYGFFERVVDVRTNVDESKVQANYKNGVLEIKIPKSTEAKTKQITIQG